MLICFHTPKAPRVRVTVRIKVWVGVSVRVMVRIRVWVRAFGKRIMPVLIMQKKLFFYIFF